MRPEEKHRTANRSDFSLNSSRADPNIKLTIGVLGMGHVGLPTAVGFSELGWDVTVADRDESKVASVLNGIPPFYEPGLQDLLAKNLRDGRLRITHDISAVAADATVLFLCVGTPQRANGEADLRDIEELARVIAANLSGYKLVVEKSTVPVVTANWIARTVRRYAGTLRRNFTLEVASNPEFLQEGKAIEGFFKPDRVVCGVPSSRAERILRTIYDPLSCNVVFTSVNTAEVIKHAANAFLATKISFINMVAELCEQVGADIDEVAAGIGADRRIGTAFLNAGIGFGGYCLPKDLKAFIHVAEQSNVDCSLLRATEQTNTRAVERFLKKVRQALWITEGKTIGILGLSFKAGTDDIRESPALKVALALRMEGAKLRLFDPKAMRNCAEIMPPDDAHVVYCRDAYEAATGCDALLVLTEWPEFSSLSLRRLRRLMRVGVLIDGRNMFNPNKAREGGFEYFGLGKGWDPKPTLRTASRPVKASPQRRTELQQSQPTLSSAQF